MHTHVVEVMEYGPAEPHPNADRLELFKPFGGYTVVVGKGQFQTGELVAYIPPDSVVPATDEFAFLWTGKTEPSNRERRIRVKRLRGVCSEGLLVKAPEDAEVGQDVATRMGVEHWEDVPKNTQGSGKQLGGFATKGPDVSAPRYDIEPMKKFHSVLVTGEQVVVTEKIHGANSRYVYVEHPWADKWIIGRFFRGKGRFHVGSRNMWKKDDGINAWSRAAKKHVGIRKMCQANPGMVLYGEVYGDVQSLNYGHGEGDVSFVAFDAYEGSIRWWDFEVFLRECHKHRVPVVPILGIGPHGGMDYAAMAEGQSTLPNTQHVREGVVVRPMCERRDPKLGRVQLKLVGNGYYENA